jgi:hypothetical protein
MPYVWATVCCNVSLAGGLKSHADVNPRDVSPGHHSLDLRLWSKRPPWPLSNRQNIASFELGGCPHEPRRRIKAPLQRPGWGVGGESAPVRMLLLRARAVYVYLYSAQQQPSVLPVCPGGYRKQARAQLQPQLPALAGAAGCETRSPSLGGQSRNRGSAASSAQSARAMI